MNDKNQDSVQRQTAQDQGQIDHSVAVPANTATISAGNNIIEFLQPSQVDMTPFAISTSVNNQAPQQVTVAPFATTTANQAVPGILSDQQLQGSGPDAILPQLPSMHPTAAAAETMPVSNQIQSAPGLQEYYQASFTPSPAESSNVYCYSPQHPEIDYRDYRPTPISTPPSSSSMIPTRTTTLPPATLLPASQPGMVSFPKPEVSFNMTKEELFSGLAQALTMAMHASSAPAPAPAPAPIDDEVLIVDIKKEPADEPQDEQTPTVNESDEDFPIPKDGQYTAAKLEQELQSLAQNSTTVPQSPAQASASASAHPQSSRIGKITAPVKPSPAIEGVKTPSNIKHLPLSETEKEMEKNKQDLRVKLNKNASSKNKDSPSASSNPDSEGKKGDPKEEKKGEKEKKKSSEIAEETPVTKESNKRKKTKRGGAEKKKRVSSSESSSGETTDTPSGTSDSENEETKTKDLSKKKDKSKSREAKENSEQKQVPSKESRRGRSRTPPSRSPPSRSPPSRSKKQDYSSKSLSGGRKKDTSASPARGSSGSTSRQRSRTPPRSSPPRDRSPARQPPAQDVSRHRDSDHPIEFLQPHNPGFTNCHDGRCTISERENRLNTTARVMMEPKTFDKMCLEEQLYYTGLRETIRLNKKLRRSCHMDMVPDGKVVRDRFASRVKKMSLEDREQEAIRMGKRQIERYFFTREKSQGDFHIQIKIHGLKPPVQK